MKRYALSIVMVVCTSYSAYAQILKPVPLGYTHDRTQQMTSQWIVAPNENMLYANAVLMQLPSKLCFKYELPKGAIFCRMEDAIYNKLNFCVKLRMGTDERYSN